MGYGKVEHGLHEQLKFQRLSMAARYYYLYLLTGPRSSKVGVFRLPPKAAAADLDVSVERVAELNAELEQGGWVRFDSTVQLVSVPARIWHDPPANGSVCAAMLKELDTLPATPLLHDEGAGLNSIERKDFHKPLRERLAGLLDTVPTPSRDGVPHRENPTIPFHGIGESRSLGANATLHSSTGSMEGADDD
jgi:hypothetical protein